MHPQSYPKRVWYQSRYAPIRSVSPLLADIQYLKFQNTHRRFHVDDLALGFAYARLSHRGFVGDLAVLHIDLLGAYDMQLHLLARFKVFKHYLVADADMLGGKVAGIEDLDILQGGFDLGDAGFDYALLVFCFIVFAVFRKVAE